MGGVEVWHFTLTKVTLRKVLMINTWQPQKEVLLACVQEILDAVDENNDGDITREEFVENALKSEFIKNLIGEEE